MKWMISFWLLLVPSVLRADALLMGELQKLRDSLSAEDPSRQELTLRLGDLYFDEMMSLAQQVSESAQKKSAQMRLNAIREFNSALSGHDGKFKAISGIRKLKVQFQLARLYTEGGDLTRARPLWNELLAQDEVSDLKREAALRLAEAEEKVGQNVKAESLYATAIQLCAGSDVCSYAYYRRAWAQKHQGKLNEAIDTIQKALFDSKGQVRDEALRDFITFLSERPTEGRAEVALIEALAEKTGRPQVLSELADQFFANGNKTAGVYTLNLVDGRSPSLKNKIRLLEEEYGLRHWDAFRTHMEEAKNMATAQTGAVDPESEKILRRLMVQLDGERVSQKDRLEDFQNAVELHLALFPTGADRLKIMEGWLAAETDLDKKRVQVKRWLSNAALQLTAEAQWQFHETLAMVAQKKGEFSDLAAEAEYLARMSSDLRKKREYTYTRARSLYALEKYNEAHPLFVELARFGENQKPDQWAIQSQNLALDILGKRKDFASVIRQAELWTRSEALTYVAKNDASLRGELNEMMMIADKARFEEASQRGHSPEALSLFLTFCTAKKFLPKSCENAKVLAVALKDQKSIFQVLEATNARTDLAAEYEAAGYFRKAAQMLEADLKPDSSESTWIKVALLHELDQSEADRNRVLSQLLKSLQQKRDLGEAESLIFVTAREAKLLGPQHLMMPWRSDHRALLAEDLERDGRGNAETRRILLAAERSTGAAWNALVWKDFDLLDRAQRKILFYGRNSKKNFESRIVALKKLVDFADLYLSRADFDLQLKILGALEQSHRDLATEILATPIPTEVAPEQVKEIQNVLADMAAPVQAKAKTYEEMIATVRTREEKATAKKEEPLVASETLDMKIARSVEELHQNPQSLQALETLKEAYTLKKKDRLASYFKGRIIQFQTAER